VEKSYYRLRSRENASLVSCDFEKLFLENRKEEDVLLRDEDQLIIPEVMKTVFVSGGVNSPGNITFDEKRTYSDYIQLAGGFNTRARTGNIKIIKGKTGTWLDADEHIVIEEGDVVFIPEREEIDWYKVFKESLTILTQIVTVIVIVGSVK
jgi:protein involved in polysaccharide export with SLBB domain